MNGIDVQLSTVQSHNSIGIGEIRNAHLTLKKDILLRLSVKGLNDCMEPEGLVPSLLVFGVIPTLSITSKSLSTQKDWMQTLALAQADMETITAELRIYQALRLNLLPATMFIINVGDNVRIYK